MENTLCVYSFADIFWGGTCGLTRSPNLNICQSLLLPENVGSHILLAWFSYEQGGIEISMEQTVVYKECVLC